MENEIGTNALSGQVNLTGVSRQPAYLDARHWELREGQQMDHEARRWWITAIEVASLLGLLTWGTIWLLFG